MEDDYNVNIHVGANGRVPGKAPPNKLAIVAFLSGTPTRVGKAGIVTKYQKKKAEKADPAKVLLFFISAAALFISMTTFCLVQEAAAAAAVKAKKHTCF